MRLATDSASKRSRGLLWTVLGLWTAVHGLGCTRLEQFRRDDRPALGTTLTNRFKTSKPAEKAAKPVDTYAQSLKIKRAQAENTLLAQRDAAGRPRASSPSLAAADRGQDPIPATSGETHESAQNGDGPIVSLQPPVPLDDKPILASNTGATPDGWQPRGGSDEANAAPSRAVATRGAPVEPKKDAVSVESLVKEARARVDGMSSYQVHLNRQERVGAKLLPVEDVLLSVRRDPKAVRLEWPEGSHKGREVIYSASENGGLMQVNMADSVVPVPRLSLPPDSPLVMSNSRHPITEAGFDTIVHNMEAAIQLEHAGTPTDGKVTYGGREQPEGLPHPCHKLLRVTPSGETWLVYIDPQTKVPALVQATAADGSLLERYLFLDLKPEVPELAQADAFDVSKRWGQPKGLLSRLGRAAADANPGAGNDTVTR